MDNRRLVLVMSLCFVLLLLWQAWQEDYAPKAPIAFTEQEKAMSQERPKDLDVPEIVARESAASQSLEVDTSINTNLQTESVIVKTDLIKVQISLKGGEITKLELKDYPVSQQTPDEPFLLLDHGKEVDLTVQSGLLSKQQAPDHHTIYKAEQTEFQLSEGQDELKVILKWVSENGVSVEKTLTFTRDSYVINQQYSVTNNSEEDWSGRVYGQLQRDTALEKSMTMIRTYTGSALSSAEDRYQKLDFDDLQEVPVNSDLTDAWFAELQHYFVVALLPDNKEIYHYYSKALDASRYVIGVYGPDIKVAPGETRDLELKIYAGPKIQKVLEKLAPGLELTVDYGVLWFIAKPVFWLLDMFHSLVGNWGWSIILVTVVIKLMFFKLSAASYRSMANMRRVTPKMTALRERFSDDKQRLNQAMMELYKKEKINPLGGCLPIVIQIPVFLSLYWVLLESVELRQAPFTLWIQDLSSKDPYFVLPVLMGVSMFLQQKLNPAPPDPLQAKMMMALPFVFTFMFATFPSGLVLYWFVNNVLSISQQWVITRKIEAG